jgi:hypothetical protein
MNTETKINRRLIGYLFTPSLLSGLVCTIAALSLTLATIGFLQYSGSSLKIDYQNYQAASHDQSVADSYRTDAMFKLISSAPLLAFWALVGLVVYLLATSVVTAVQQANEMKHELDYVNSNRTRLLGTVFLHFVIRCAVIAIWLPYLLFFFHQVVPYAITAAEAGGLLTLDGVVGAVLSVIIMALALHVHVFLLRVLLLRPRVLSRALYVS